MPASTDVAIAANPKAVTITGANTPATIVSTIRTIANTESHFTSFIVLLVYHFENA